MWVALFCLAWMALATWIAFDTAPKPFEVRSVRKPGKIRPRRLRRALRAQAAAEAAEAEPTLESTEAALFETLQDAEYRVPYEPPPAWPLAECDHDWEHIHNLGQMEPVASFCTRCGAKPTYRLTGAGTEVDPYLIAELMRPPAMPPGDDPRTGRQIRSYLG